MSQLKNCKRDIIVMSGGGGGRSGAKSTANKYILEAEEKVCTLLWVHLPYQIFEK